MRVTIIADASYCATHKVAGYGYWIACERGKKPGGGILGNGGLITTVVHNSLSAEMMAVCRAIHEGLRDRLIHRGDELLIQTDCQAAIHHFTKPQMEDINFDQWRVVYKVFKEQIKKYQLTVSFKHVKGHTSFKEARYAANRNCDRRAKEAMRQARNKVVIGARMAEVVDEESREIDQATEHLHHYGYGRG